MKGIIKENLGESRYTVGITLKSRLLDAEIAKFQALYDKAQIEVPKRQLALFDAREIYKAALSEIDEANDGYTACLNRVNYDDCLSAAIDNCDAALDACRSACYASGGHIGCLNGCADDFDACEAAARTACNAAMIANTEACQVEWMQAITAAQQAALPLLGAVQEAMLQLRNWQTVLLSTAKRLNELKAIDEQARQITCFSAQYNEDLEIDDEVFVAITPAGRYVITDKEMAWSEIEIARLDCFMDARVFNGKYLFGNAALATGLETWAPSWRTGTVTAITETNLAENKLTVEVDPGILHGTLGTQVSRRDIDCTPSQAYFDGEDGTARNEAIVAARAALEAAQEARIAAQAALDACLDGYGQEFRAQCYAAKVEACTAQWDELFITCMTETGGDAEYCTDAYTVGKADCIQAGEANCIAQAQAGIEACNTSLLPSVLNAREVVIEAQAQLARVMTAIYNPASPLSLEIPVAHCVASRYEVDDSVLIDFPERNYSSSAMAVWDSARVIGWASETRECLAMDNGWATASLVYTGDEPIANFKCRTDAEGVKYVAITHQEIIDNQYEPFNEYNPDDSVDVWAYSGLTRLFIQSIRGIGKTWDKNFASLLPGWTDDPITLGCFRSPEGVYYLAQIGYDIGLWVVKLKIKDAYACLIKGHEIDGITDAQRQALDAVIMGNSEVDGDPIQIVDPEESEWADIYSDGKQVKTWGWSWRFQKRGATDEELCGAIICTHRISTTVDSLGNIYRTIWFHEAKVDITFDDEGIPVAVVSESASGTIPKFGDYALNSFSTVTADGISTIFTGKQIRDEPDESSTLGIMASCYMPDGGIGGVRYEGSMDSDYGPYSWMQFISQWEDARGGVWSRNNTCVKTGTSPNVVTTATREFWLEQHEIPPTLVVNGTRFDEAGIYNRAEPTIATTISTQTGADYPTVFTGGPVEQQYGEINWPQNVFINKSVQGIVWVRRPVGLDGHSLTANFAGGLMGGTPDCSDVGGYLDYFVPTITGTYPTGESYGWGVTSEGEVEAPKVWDIFAPKGTYRCTSADDGYAILEDMYSNTRQDEVPSAFDGPLKYGVSFGGDGPVTGWNPVTDLDQNAIDNSIGMWVGSI